MNKLWGIFIFAMLAVTLSERFSESECGPLGEKVYIRKELFFYTVMAVVLSAFVGLRTWYNDTPTYAMGYEMTPASGPLFEGLSWQVGDNFGFEIVNRLMRRAGFSTQTFFMIYAIITNGIYLWFLRKYTDDLWLMVFFYFTMGVYTFTLAAIKQCVAVAFCMVATDRAIQKRYVSFILWVLLATTFHPYALMYLVVPFVTFGPWTWKTYILLAVFAILGISLEYLLGTVVDITSMLGEEFNEESFSGEGVNVFRLAVVWVPVIISYVVRRHLQTSENRANNIIMNLSMLNAEIMFVALFGTANYFARLANYFLILQTISLPFLFRYFNEQSKRFMKACAVIGFIIYFYYANGINQPFDGQYNSVTIWEYLFPVS